MFLLLGRKVVFCVSMLGSCFQSSRALNYKVGQSVLGKTEQIGFYRRHLADNRVLTTNQVKF